MHAFDRQTDGQTEFFFARPPLHSMQRGENRIDSLRLISLPEVLSQDLRRDEIRG